MKNFYKGRYAEFLARCYMFLHGYKLLQSNYISGRGTTAGEIDFIAKRGKTIVFVEVKQRKNLNDAAYSISKNQQERLIRGAQNFIKQHPQYKDCDFRFDAVLISFPCHIRHIKNAWSA